MEDRAVHRIILAIGTNAGQEANMKRATGLLERTVTDMRCSRALWTKPIGIDSDSFLNRIVAGTSVLKRDELQEEIRRIERECGRNAVEKERGIVRMDIDVLKYDDRTEHPDDWEREYVKLLIKEI